MGSSLFFTLAYPFLSRILFSIIVLVRDGDELLLANLIINKAKQKNCAFASSMIRHR